MCLLLNQYDNHESSTADRVRRRDAERNIVLFCLFSPECKTVVVKVLSNWYVMHRVGQNICKCTETKTSKNIPCCCYAVALFHFHLSSRVIKETDEKNCTLNHLCKPRLWSRAAVRALLCMRCCACAAVCVKQLPRMETESFTGQARAFLRQHVPELDLSMWDKQQQQQPMLFPFFANKTGHSGRQGGFILKISEWPPSPDFPLEPTSLRFHSSSRLSEAHIYGAWRIPVSTCCFTSLG